MIRITCTHCRQVLTIDDGFAGGVCRCQHCGTIQTVPAAPGKTKGRGAAPAARTLYRSERRPQEHHHPGDSHIGSGSGLDQLAEVVSSSGLHHSARMGGRPSGGNGSPISLPRRKSNRWVLYVVIAVILAVLAVVVIQYLRYARPQPPVIETPLNPAPTPAMSGPNFAGMAIQAPDTVVYLLDNGGSAGDVLPAMEAACFQSIKSLGKDHRFKVMFWRADSPSYPADGTARATDDEESKCEAALKDSYAQGSTQVDDSLKSAIAAQADAVVLITVKAAQLSDDFTQTVMSIRGDTRTRIYTVGVNGDSSTGALATIASQTGGSFLNISSADLNRLAH
jgi:von Willebrand factor type A domain